MISQFTTRPDFLNSKFLALNFIKIELFGNQFVLFGTRAVGIHQDKLLFAASRLLFRKAKQSAPRLFPGSGLHCATTPQMQSFGKAKPDKVRRCLCRNDDRKASIGTEQLADFPDETRKWQAHAVASQSSTFVGRQRVLCEERRIAEYRIEWERASERQDICFETAHSLAKRAFCHVLLCLSNRLAVNIYAQNHGTRISLCSHHRYQSGARPDVQDAATLDTSPCTEQHTVRADLHGAPIMADVKLFETEEIVTHSLRYGRLFVISVQIYKKIRD